MIDQTLPSFDSETSNQEAPAPRKPRPRRAKKPTKRVKHPAAKPAKRVAKKRRQMARRVKLPESKPTDIFPIAAYQAIGTLMGFDLPIRRMILSVVQGLSK